MTQNVFSIQASSFEGFSRTYFKLGTPCPQGKWQVTDRLEALGNNQVMTNSVITVNQLWPDGSIKWLSVEGLCDAEVLSDNTPSVAVSIAKSHRPPINHALPVKEESEHLHIQLKNGDWVNVHGQQLMALTYSSKLHTQFYSLTANETLDTHVSNVVTDYELLDNPLGYQAVRIQQCATLNEGTHIELDVNAQYTLFLDDGTVKGSISITNPAAASHPHGQWDLGDPNSIDIFELGLCIKDFNQASLLINEHTYSIDACDQLSVFQASSGKPRWNSPNHVNRDNKVPLPFCGYRVRKDGHLVDEGRQCVPRVNMQASPHQTRSMLTVKDFWQNFPSSIVATPSSIDMSLLGSRFAAPIELQPGEQKTRDIRLCHTPVSDAETRLNKEWVAASKAISFLPDTTNEFHDLIQYGIRGDTSFFHKREVIDEFGWRHFGELYADHETALNSDNDIFVSHYNNQYDPIYGMLCQWILTGERAWFTLADALAKHVADIDVYHTDKDKPEYNGGLFWHTDHYVQACTATHRTYSKRQPSHVYEDHAGGGGPGGQHGYTSGLALHYLLTGRPTSKKAALSITHWLTHYYEGDGTMVGALLALKNSGSAGLKCVKTNTYPLDRGTGNYLHALFDRFELLGTQSDIDSAAHVIRHTVSPQDDITSRHLEDVENTWFYTVFLQAVCRFIQIKTQLNTLDSDYDYAVKSLQHYARWMLDNEYAYLDKPEILEFPNQTWSGQDLRKLCVLHFAASLLRESDAKRVMEKIHLLKDTILARLKNHHETSTTRVLCLMMQNAHYEAYKIEPKQARKVTRDEPNESAITHRQPYSVVKYFARHLRHFSFQRERQQFVKRFVQTQKWLGKP